MQYSLPVTVIFPPFLSLVPVVFVVVCFVFNLSIHACVFFVSIVESERPCRFHDPRCSALHWSRRDRFLWSLDVTASSVTDLFLNSYTFVSIPGNHFLSLSLHVHPFTCLYTAVDETGLGTSCYLSVALSSA